MTVMERTGTVSHFIGGEAVESASGRTFASIDPATGEEIAQVAFGDAEDIDRAVAAGRAVFESGEWAKASPGHRANVLRRLADLIHQDADRIGAIESRDTGKPLGQAIAEVNLAADFFTYFASHAELPNGRTHPADAGYFVYSIREPYGVVGAITPVELPVPARVLEDRAGARGGQLRSCSRWPSRRRSRPRTSGRSTLEAGMPAGVFNIVHGDGPTTGAALVAHPHVPKLTFTGSTTTGQAILRIGRGAHQERPPRARRQDPEHHLRRRGHRPGDRRLAVHGLLQHGPDLHERHRACWSSATRRRRIVEAFVERAKGSRWVIRGAATSQLGPLDRARSSTSA